MKLLQVVGLAAALMGAMLALSWWRGGSGTGDCPVCPLAGLLQAAAPATVAERGAAASSSSAEASHAKEVAMSCCPGASGNNPSAASNPAGAARSASAASDSAQGAGPFEVEERPLPKTEAEWRKRLTPEQYRVLRQKGTERAFTGKYDKMFEPGVYRCAGCGAVLFASDAKYDSGCGWPAFYEPLAESNIETRRDLSHGMVRTEVLCKRCGGHLGHVFNDGPRPTGLRYCINSVSLEFDRAAPKPAATTGAQPPSPRGAAHPAPRGEQPATQNDAATDPPADPPSPAPAGDSGSAGASPPG